MRRSLALVVILCLISSTAIAQTCAIDNPLAEVLGTVSEAAAGSRTIQVNEVLPADRDCFLGRNGVTEQIVVSLVHYGPIRNGKALTPSQLKTVYRRITRSSEGLVGMEATDLKSLRAHILERGVSGRPNPTEGQVDKILSYVESFGGPDARIWSLRYVAPTDWGLLNEYNLVIIQRPGDNELLVLDILEHAV